MSKEIATVKRNSRGINIDFSILGLLIMMVIFFGRCFYIVTNSDERGGFAYVQMLNYGLPLLEEVAYDEGAYVENELSLKNVALEALGLSNLGGETILGSEMPLVKAINTHNDEMPEYNDFELGDSSISKYDKENDGAAYDPKLKEELKSKKPKILIYNTHGTENYAESKKFTTNKEYSVVGVAEVIEKELKEKYGIEVIFDRTVHDLSYNDGYKKSKQTVEKYVKKYGNNFDLVIDIHRDSGKNKKPFYNKINGEDIARIMFVNTRSSQYFAENDKVARDMIKIADDLFPGLMRQSPILTRNKGLDDYSQQVAKNSILIEVGSTLNTSKEAQKSGEYIARIIAEYINKK